MKRVTVTEARARFADLLDDADHGETVIIERRDVQYVIRRRPAKRKRPARNTRYFEWIDPAVMSGQWTWGWGPKGLEFVDLRPKRTRKRR